MNFRQEFENEPGEQAERAAGNSELSQSGESDLKQALVNFRLSIDAWSAAEFARVRPGAKVVRRSWRLAASWALAGLLTASGISSGVYAHHRQAQLAEAARLAVQQRAAREVQIHQQEEDLLANVDNDVTQSVPSAMEPLAQLTTEDETR